MKKLFACLSVLLAFAILLCGCGGAAPAETTATTADETPTATTPAETTAATTAKTETTAATTEETTAPPCAHDYERTVTTAAGLLTDGLATCVCKLCGDTYTETIPAKSSIKILLIGNSFSEDAKQYLWDICTAAGIKDVVIGELYVPGCTVDQHWQFINLGGRGNHVYAYRENTDGTWKNTTAYPFLDALQKCDWDFITLQQGSPDSGRPETFGNLQNVVDYINAHKTNADAKLYWHMTWAYQANSTHTAFPKYDKNQMTMYGAITSTVQSVILPNAAFAGVIPSGTTIQNLRTSYLGDTLTRDGYHLSYDVGRYAAALTYFKVLTGLDIENINWLPAEYPGLDAHLLLIKEAVNAATLTPYGVTACKTPQRAYAGK